MTALIIILIAIYVIGIPVSFNLIKDWKHKTCEKVVFSIIWPLMAILYGIHVIHNME